VKRTAKLVVMAAACLVLAGCAALTKLAYSNAALAYNNLAPMMAWMVDEYVDVSGSQKDWVRDRIARVMSWHRSHELPEYRRFLAHVLAESREPFSAEEIAAGYREIRLHYERTVEQVLPDVADFFLQLDSLQVAQMEKKFAEDNRKFVRESLKGTPEERRARRIKRLVMHLESWLGELDNAQEELVASHYRELPDYVEERLAERRFRQTEVLALIRARPARDEMIAGLRRLFVSADAWRRPEFARRLRERDQRFFEMFARLSATLSAEQRATLQRRIRGYMRDINEIAASN
jgi:hypothetical protein